MFGAATERACLPRISLVLATEGYNEEDDPSRFGRLIKCKGMFLYSAVSSPYVKALYARWQTCSL